MRARSSSPSFFLAWLQLVLVVGGLGCRPGRAPEAPLVLNIDSLEDFPLVQARVDRCRAGAKEGTACRGAIYVWSPRMPLSQIGMIDIAKAAEELSLSLTILNAGVIYDGLGTPDHTVDTPWEPTGYLSDYGLLEEMVSRGGTIHYPALILYDAEGLRDAAVLGYKTAAAYRLLIEERLKLGERVDTSVSANAGYVLGQAGSHGPSAGVEHEHIDVDGSPGAYFRWVPRTSLVAYEAGRAIHLLDITDGSVTRGPGFADFAPSPDGIMFITPGPDRSGLEFYDREEVFREVRKGAEESVEPVFLDPLMKDQYPSVGILSATTDGSRTTYRVLTSWHDKVIFRDYDVRWDSGLRVRPKGLPVPACPKHQLSLPMMSQDGRELAARDETTASTKIFRLRDDGTCDEDLDFGIATGKVAWHASGGRIAFAIPRGLVHDGMGILWRADNAHIELAGIFVYERDEVRVTRVYGSEDVNRLAFPEFIGQDTVMFLMSPTLPGEKSRFRVVWPVR